MGGVWVVLCVVCVFAWGFVGVCVCVSVCVCDVVRGLVELALWRRGSVLGS